MLKCAIMGAILLGQLMVNSIRQVSEINVKNRP
jgi:hypothetical protein